MEKVIPVYVLIGYLGSGKTTLLNRVLDHAAGEDRKVAVLLNELGEANVEGRLLGPEVPMAEMLGGCICCTVRADLGFELTKLAREHRPDAIWIESTGVARPLEIMDAVAEASMSEKLALCGVVAVADGPQLLDRVRVGAGKTLRLMKEQLAAASHVLLNKSDLLGLEERKELERLLREWNPGARLSVAVRAETDLDAICDDASDFLTAGNEVAIATDLESHHLEHGAHEHVSALTVYLPGPVDSRAFEAFVERLPEGVYRAKGIVTFRETNSRFLFQYAYGASDYMRIQPQGETHDVVVLIGEGFPRRELRERLSALATATGKGD
ncbi:CobW family GTP-binding protein [Paenibacillaceae bacterium WGS1546]|uniref:CobW family GTP-binding protein n=1 Tax=Cohnella sp. WGS1546 TaxID=3366810 RepID=UPI00372D1E35